MKHRNFAKEYLPYVLFLVFGLVFLAKPVLDMDEIWNYGFASYITNGLQPYTDFNMIQTPLSAYIASMVLSVFGNSLFVFRILGAVLFGLTFGLSYTICRKVIKNRPVAFALSSFLGTLCSLIWMYNYNHLILLCILAIIFCELQMEIQPEQKTRFLNVFIGLIYGLTPVIKQSTGAILILFNAVWCGYKIAAKPDDRGSLISRLAMSGLPSVLFILCIIITGSFDDFYDYAVMGVQTFTHRETWVDYILSSPTDFFVGVFPLCVTLISICSLIKGRSRVSRSFHIVTLILSWAGAVVAYPICDFVHACVAIVPFVIPLLCCVGELRVSQREGIACCFVAILVLSCSSMLILKDLPKYKQCELLYFEGLPISPEIEEQIQIVDAFLLEVGEDEVDAIIADEDAAAYMIPIEKYYKNFNLLLIGNIGSNSVEDLLWRESAIYLVARNEESLGKQAHTDLVEYIKKNYTKIGEVLGFDAYTP